MLSYRRLRFMNPRNEEEQRKYDFMLYVLEKRDYLSQKHKLYFPASWGIGECYVLERTLETLGFLTTPEKLAKFLGINIDYVYEGIEDGLLPHFAGGGMYAIKVVEIYRFLEKHFFWDLSWKKF